MEPSIKCIAIANEILEELSDRRGIRQAFEECDPDIQVDIRDAIASIIQEHLES